MQKKFTYLLLLLLFGFGCEQVIDMDLNDAGPKLVIEADLSHPDGLLTVVLSRTSSYFEPNSGERVEYARVQLININGIQKDATAKGNGVYQLSGILTEPGDSFRLLVEVDGVVHSAVSTLEAPAEIDTITYSYYDGDDFFRPGYRFSVTFTDALEKKNYYRIRVYKNAYLFNRPGDMVVFDDTDRNGQAITVRLHNQFYLEKGEAVVLELMSVDRQAWEYFTSLSEAINATPGSPAPANPVSSFTNGALGYFYAWSYNRKRVVIEN